MLGSARRAQWYRDMQSCRMTDSMAKVEDDDEAHNTQRSAQRSEPEHIPTTNVHEGTLYLYRTGLILNMSQVTA